MPRAALIYVCQTCGDEASRWSGKCDACGAWNTLQPEERGGPPAAGGVQALKPSKRLAAQAMERLRPISAWPAEDAGAARLVTGNEEFDRVTGGGLVAGSALLIGGDPGVGKSTLLLQIAAAAARTGAKTLYLTGEESVGQVAARARRLGADPEALYAASATKLSDVAAMIDACAPELVVVDSAQTLWTDAIPAAPGSVAQMRACTLELVRQAKRRDARLVLIGHVTKDGQLAGPRVVEHMVDAAFMIEGDRTQRFRILRAMKNRFGPTDEIGVFEMREDGMREVENPSVLFLGEREDRTSGSIVLAAVEGARSLLVDVQALVAPNASGGSPRRTVAGWESSRLAMTLAILEARCGLELSREDVYLNVAGGLRITEPAMDLAAAVALASSHLDIAPPPGCVAFGETALSGAVRPVGRMDARLKEAAKLGFKTAITPKLGGADHSDLHIVEIDHIARLPDALRDLEGA